MACHAAQQAHARIVDPQLRAVWHGLDDGHPACARSCCTHDEIIVEADVHRHSRIGNTYGRASTSSATCWYTHAIRQWQTFTAPYPAGAASATPAALSPKLGVLIAKACGAIRTASSKKRTSMMSCNQLCSMTGRIDRRPHSVCCPRRLSWSHYLAIWYGRSQTAPSCIAGAEDARQI